jgi:hypothetical protein
VYLTKKEIDLVLRAISEYEEAIHNMSDDSVEHQTKTYNYSESAVNKISLKLIKHKRKI